MRSLTSPVAGAMLAIVLAAATLAAAPPVRVAREPEWRTRIADARRALAAGQLPQARLFLRQSCAAALAAQAWGGVLEAFTVLAETKQAPPAYFYDYLRRAEESVRAAGEYDTYVPVARAWLAAGKPEQALVLLRDAFARSLDRARFADAIAAAVALAAAGRAEEAMGDLVRVAKFALEATHNPACLDAAQAMYDLGIPAAGRRWTNLAAQALLKAKEYKGLLRAIELLEKNGFKEDASYWDASVH